MTKHLPSSRSPRDIAVEERRQNLLEFKAKMMASPEADENSTTWHAIDDPITPEQYDQIPPGRPGVCGRTKPLWVKYRHRDQRQIVIAKGVYDHETGEWLVRYDAVDDGDRLRCVEPIAWAKIVSGITPKDAPMVPSPPGGEI